MYKFGHHLHSLMLLDKRKWKVLDLSFYGVPQRRRRCIFHHGFDLPPADAAAMTLRSCGFDGVVGSACHIHQDTWRDLSHPAHTVYSRGRPYLVLDNGTRRVVTLDESAQLQGFPIALFRSTVAAFGPLRGSLRKWRHIVDDAVPPPVAKRIVLAALAGRDTNGSDVVVDLFCGGGGFGVGAAMAGVQNIIAVDSDPMRLRIYKAMVGSFGARVQTCCCDLADKNAWERLCNMITESEFTPRHIHASPPCVGVSAANWRRAEAQPQGLAFLHLVNAFVRAFPTATVSAENGPRLVSTYAEFSSDGDDSIYVASKDSAAVT